MVPKSTILLPAGLTPGALPPEGRPHSAISLLNSFLILGGAFQLPLLLPLTVLPLCEVRGLYFKQMGK